MVNEAIQIQNPGASGLSRQHEDEEILSPGLVQMSTANQLCSITIQAYPLPPEVTRLLESNVDLIRTLDQYSAIMSSEKSGLAKVRITAETLSALKLFKDELSAAFDEAGDHWKGSVDHIIACGPRRVGPNLLLNRVPGYNRHSMWHCLDKTDVQPVARDFDSSIISGFQMATLAGPLCEEPLMGVAFCLNLWTMDASLIRQRGVSECETPTPRTSECDDDSICVLECATPNLECDSHLCDSNLQGDGTVTTDKDDCVDEARPSKSSINSDKIVDSDEKQKRKHPLSYGPFSGQLMSCMKDSCRKAFQSQPQRLMAAMYTCDIQVPSDVLGTYKLTVDYNLTLVISTINIYVNLRSKDLSLLVVPKTNLKIGKRSFSVCGPHLWNSLPISLRKAESLESFKSGLKMYYFKKEYLNV